ncbi:MAG: acetate kinase [Methylophilaceae bacterium]|nr:acetate kinase [Methylophilaceae bacterium]
MDMAVLTVNSGSSSVKASFFAADGRRRDLRYEHIGRGRLRDHHTAFETMLEDLGDDRPAAVGHRFVHGGSVADAARRLDAAEMERLRGVVHLAPLHLPDNLLGAEICMRHFDVPHVACFDTAFHTTLPELAWRLPVRAVHGLRRYGFHGLNYAHVAHRLPALIGDTAYGRVVVAHLGNGASLCLLENLKSVDTSMGFTPAGGIPMGTRSGDLDPGVMLELARRMDVTELEQETFHRMGLLALSDGESSDMRRLLESDTAAAHFAVDYFCRQVRGAIGALAAKCGGIDALVFTAGIGERSAVVREKICAPLAFLGFELAPEANRCHATLLSTPSSRPILMIPADEEAVIRRLTLALLQPSPRMH